MLSTTFEILRYQLSQDNHEFILSIEKIGEKIRMTLVELPGTRQFSNIFSLEELKNIDGYFGNFNNIEEAAKEINSIVQFQKVGIVFNTASYQQQHQQSQQFQSPFVLLNLYIFPPNENINEKIINQNINDIVKKIKNIKKIQLPLFFSEIEKGRMIPLEKEKLGFVTDRIIREVDDVVGEYLDKRMINSLPCHLKHIIPNIEENKGKTLAGMCTPPYINNQYKLENIQIITNDKNIKKDDINNCNNNIQNNTIEEINNSNNMNNHKIINNIIKINDDNNINAMNDINTANNNKINNYNNLNNTNAINNFNNLNTLNNVNIVDNNNYIPNNNKINNVREINNSFNYNRIDKKNIIVNDYTNGINNQYLIENNNYDQVINKSDNNKINTINNNNPFNIAYDANVNNIPLNNINTNNNISNIVKEVKDITNIQYLNNLNNIADINTQNNVISTLPNIQNIDNIQNLNDINNKYSEHIINTFPNMNNINEINTASNNIYNNSYSIKSERGFSFGPRITPSFNNDRNESIPKTNYCLNNITNDNTSNIINKESIKVDLTQVNPLSYVQSTAYSQNVIHSDSNIPNSLNQELQKNSDKNNDFMNYNAFINNGVKDPNAPKIYQQVPIYYSPSYYIQTGANAGNSNDKNIENLEKEKTQMQKTIETLIKESGKLKEETIKLSKENEILKENMKEMQEEIITKDKELEQAKEVNNYLNNLNENIINELNKNNNISMEKKQKLLQIPTFGDDHIKKCSTDIAKCQEFNDYNLIDENNNVNNNNIVNNKEEGKNNDLITPSQNIISNQENININKVAQDMTDKIQENFNNQIINNDINREKEQIINKINNETHKEIYNQQNNEINNNTNKDKNINYENDNNNADNNNNYDNNNNVGNNINNNNNDNNNIDNTNIVNNNDNNIEYYENNNNTNKDILNINMNNVNEMNNEIDVYELNNKNGNMSDNSSEGQIKGNILRGMNEVDLLTDRIKKDYQGKVIYCLVFKATVDGDRASDFHEKCDQTRDNLILIETKDGHRFGGFSSVSWDGQNAEKKDENSFVFSLDKLKVYNLPNPGIFCSPNLGPTFLDDQLKLNDNFFTNGGIANEELYEGKEFDVKEVEVYQLEEEEDMTI